MLKLRRLKAIHLGINQNDDSTRVGVRETEHATGCCMIGRRILFETIGLLDEDYFFGNEDWAHSCVAKMHGLLRGVNLNAKIYHKPGGSLEEGNPIYLYYYNKNRLLILKKHGSLIEQMFGFSFYAFSHPIKFQLWISKGRVELIRAELQVICDFLAGRYGDYDRKRVNRHG